VLNIPSPADWTLRLDPLPELSAGDRVLVDWETMKYKVVNDLTDPSEIIEADRES
jgi:hypothetical protein